MASRVPLQGLDHQSHRSQQGDASWGPKVQEVNWIIQEGGGGSRLAVAGIMELQLCATLNTSLVSRLLCAVGAISISISIGQPKKLRYKKDR